MDAHNIVPAWVASPKEEIGARTLRPKIHNVLAGFLKKFPPVVRHRHPWKKLKCKKVDWKSVDQMVRVDKSAAAVENITPGTRAGLENLASFVSKGGNLIDSGHFSVNSEFCSNSLGLFLGSLPW